MSAWWLLLIVPVCLGAGVFLGALRPASGEYQAFLDKTRWTPVENRSMHSGLYLVACNEWGGSAVRKAAYDDFTGKWLEFSPLGAKDITKVVTHWMPLPEPPMREIK